jgi:hypothetical protein
MQKMAGKLEKFGEKTKKVGDKLSNIGQKMTTFITLPIIAAGTASIKFASDFTESMNKVEVAFGDNAEGVKEWSKTTLKNFGIAQGSALDMAALFGDMSTSMGLTTDVAEEMSTSLVGLAGDLASFKNIRIEQAQTALASIYTGETESLKKLGIVMTEVNLQEFAYSKGITKKIKDMTQTEKVMLRYNYVMSKSANAHGDFLRTGGGAANQMRIMQESLKELANSFGQILLPIFTKVITKMNEWIQRFNALSPRAKKIILIILAITAAIGPLTFIIGKLISSIGTLMKVVKFLVTPQGLLITGIILAVVAAIILIIVVIKNWGKITSWTTDKWKKFVDYIKRMPRIIFILIAAFAPFLLLPILIIRNWERLKKFFTFLWRSIVNIFFAVINKISEVWNTFMSWLLGKLEEWGITKFLKELWAGIVGAFKIAIGKIKELWIAFTDWAKNNPVLKWLFETKPGKLENQKKKEAEKEEKKKKEEEKKKEKKTLLNMDEMFKKFKGGMAEKNIVYVNVKVSAEDGSVATIDRVKSTGKMKKKIQSDSNLRGWSH